MRTNIHAVKSDGKTLATVTQILNSVMPLGMGAVVSAVKLTIAGQNYQEVWNISRDVGSVAHDMIRCHLLNVPFKTTEYSQDIIDKAENSFLSYLSWEKQHTLEPIFIEKELSNADWGYGGHCDFFGKIDGKYTMLDYKTGKFYDSQTYQLAAYELLLPQPYSSEEFRLVRLPSEENLDFEERVFTDLSLEKEIWWSILRIYKLQQEIKSQRKVRK